MRESFLSRLFGGSCFVCRGAARAMLCEACDAELPRLSPPLCPRCALPSPEEAVCGRCLTSPPHFDATVAALAYEFPADALIHALKFRGELALSGLLGTILNEKLAGHQVDCVVPVPLTRDRLRERGYNQAVEIARATGRPIELELCRKIRQTAPQVDLPLHERVRNVRGAFDCTHALDGAAIAVVDDVMTTGATLDEVAKTLKSAGAARVVNWVVARTLPRD